MTTAASAPRDDTPAADEDVRRAIRVGRTALGIELGSTRIKACLIDEYARVLATASSAWENAYIDGVWTYSLDAVEEGLRRAYADLVADVERRYDVRPESYGSLGVSAMMHGYLAFDGAGELLVPFRTWRNTSTGEASAELSELFGLNIPLRWSIAHLHQAVRDGEPHVRQLASVTTLAGYVHRRLSGRHVLGVGDASGMFPIAATGTGYDADLLARYDALAGDALPAPLTKLLPEVLTAGADAGELTMAGAAWLDPTGTLRPGVRMCPPEGDAGTGMVATNAVEPRTGNVSAGTSVFAMVVLEGPLTAAHEEVDLVTTPTGAPVAMVHCNNGASELGAWAGVFAEFAAAVGGAADPDAVFGSLLGAAVSGDADAGGVVAYNHLAGEPIAGLREGRPLIVRTPGSRLSLANLMRAQVYGVFGTLSLGMAILADEGVRLDRMYAHGGMFRTAGVAQRFLAGALGVPVTVADTASEGGAWGMAVLALFAAQTANTDLADYLTDRVFAGAPSTTLDPDPADVAGYAIFLDRYRAGLAAEAAAADAL